MLKRALAIVSSTEPPPTLMAAGNNFLRKTDPSILVIRSSELVTQESVSEAAKSWLLDSNFEEDSWKMDGEAAGKRFVVRVKGAPGWAPRRVSQALGNLRLENGEFRRMQASTAPGERSDLHVSEDKNVFQVRRELATKQARRTMVAIYPNV